MGTLRPYARGVAAAFALTLAAGNSHAVHPGLALAEVLQPEVMAVIMLPPVTSQSTLDALGSVINVIPFFKDYYAPVQEWAPKARTFAITRAGPIEPPTTPPLASEPVHVPSSYSQVIAFGDSMSDTGNLFKMTDRMVKFGMPAAPSYDGRFSNGRVALEVMADQLRVPLTNYCFSGAQTGRGNLLPFLSWQKGVLFQIDEYTARLAKARQPADPDALYFIWAGPNDFFEGLNMYTSWTAKRANDNLFKGMQTLYLKGARHFLVPNMPDLSLTPQSAAFDKEDRGYKDASRLRSDEFKAEMDMMLAKARLWMPAAHIRTFDNLGFLRAELPKAAAEGVNVTQACYTGKLVKDQVVKDVCADPDQYLFWDKNHPTARANRILGSGFAQAAVRE